VLARGAIFISLIGACSDHAARVTLAPIALPSDDPTQPCGNPPAGSVTTMRIVAYTQTQQLTFTGTELDNLPDDTLQFAVELQGGEGGADLAVGKTAPIASFSDLADGTVLPVAMLPPSGFCHAGSMNAPRLHPAIARAGNGVLVVGGLGSGSGALAEYYDSATATFETIDVPGSITSLDGASLATMPDGLVTITIGEGALVFDPSDQKLFSPSLLDLGDGRSGHASIALDDTRVLVSGGCAKSSGYCGSGDTALQTSVVYAVNAEGQVMDDGDEPALPGTSRRFGGTLFDPGPLEDGSRRTLLAVATPDLTSGDFIPIDASGGAASSTVIGMYADAAMLDGGGVLSAFAPDGSAQTGAGSIVPPDPGAPLASPTLFAPPLDGARLVLAEDGTVVAIGDATIGSFDPTTQIWTSITPVGDVPSPLAGPSLVRLPDGSVLVLGGGVTPSATAWLYRPSLVGPSDLQVVALQSEPGVLTPSSPANTMGGASMTLTAAGDLTSRALVGGIRTATGSITATLSLGASAGVALIAEQTAPGSLLDVQLVPGQTPVIERRVAGAITTLCSSGSITSAELATGVGLTVTSTTVTATFSQAQTPILSCSVAGDPGAGTVGQWGIAAIGTGAITVSSVIASRGQ
jgi:hypothetical protein